jgi:hypothetical protein
MPRIICRIVPEPQEATRPIYKKNNGNKIEPFIVGTGDIDYICGRCDNIIAQNVLKVKQPQMQYFNVQIVKH